MLQLAEGADFLVESYLPSYLPSVGLGYAQLHQRNPTLVVTSMTPFGQTGPWAGYRANNLIVSNLSGHSRGHAGLVENTVEQPPLQLAAHQADFVAGLTGATASMLALIRRRRTGEGCHVDVSGMEALALLNQTTLAEFDLGFPAQGRRKDQAVRQALLTLLPCRDGYVGISPRQQDQWERFVELMDSPQWADDARFATRDSRLDHWADLEPLLAAWTSGYSKEEVYRLAQDRRIPCFPLNTAADLFTSSQFHAREFFTEVAHPAAGTLKYPGFPVRLRSGKRLELELAPAPLLGQHNHEVLGDEGLGLKPKDLVSLRAQEII